MMRRVLTTGLRRQPVERVVALTVCPNLSAQRKGSGGGERTTVRVNVGYGDLDGGVVLRSDQTVCTTSTGI